MENKKLSIEDLCRQNKDEQMVLEALDAIKHQPFFQRVSNIPLVNRTVTQLSNAYESTKNSSGMLKYSAESVESVTKTISQPVLNTLEPVLTPLDRFACHQLDSIEKTFPSILQDRSPRNDSNIKGQNGNNYEPSKFVNNDSRHSDTWPKVVGSVGANLGMFGDETLRALRYCLQYLQHAASSIAHHAHVLKYSIEHAFGSTSKIMSSSRNEDGSPASSLDNLTVLLASVKREVVETLRRVVEVLGQYSSRYLPLDAKNTVRSFILNLPSRLALRKSPEISAQKQEAEHVVMLANESQSMINGIETVINQAVEAAEFTLGHKNPLEPRKFYDCIDMETLSAPTDEIMSRD